MLIKKVNYTDFIIYNEVVCSQRGLNSRPSAHKTDALPTELRELNIYIQ